MPKPLEIQAHRDALSGHILLHLTHRQLPKVEYGGGQNRVRFAFNNALGEVLQLAHTAGSNDGDAHCPGNRPSQRQVKAMEVSNISPAPRRAASTAQATASTPVSSLPPLT